MNNLDLDYQNLLKDILNDGNDKTDRTGTGTLSVFGRQIRHKMSDGFPLLTTKKMAWKSITVELIWFLRGDTNIKYLVENNCNIWNGDCYKRYVLEMQLGKHGAWLDESSFINEIKSDDEFAKKWGDLGSIYGKQWRYWGGIEKTYKYGIIQFQDNHWVMKWTDLHSFAEGSHWCYTKIKNHATLSKKDIGRMMAFENSNDEPFDNYVTLVDENEKGYVGYFDQIQNSINLLKTNPDSRRIIVSAWNPSDLNKMVLPPCHYGFQFYTRELSDVERYKFWFNNNYETGIEYNENNQPDYDDEYYVKTPKRALSLMWNQRSVDTFLGLPFNIASYALLLSIVANEVNMVADELIGNLGDTHLYLNHIEQSKLQITRKPLNLPKLTINDEFWNPDRTPESFGWTIKGMEPHDFILDDYDYHPPIKAPLSN